MGAMGCLLHCLCLIGEQVEMWRAKKSANGIGAIILIHTYSISERTKFWIGSIAQLPVKSSVEILTRFRQVKHQIYEFPNVTTILLLS